MNVLPLGSIGADDVLEDTAMNILDAGYCLLQVDNMNSDCDCIPVDNCYTLGDGNFDMADDVDDIDCCSYRMHPYYWADDNNWNNNPVDRVDSLDIGMVDMLLGHSPPLLEHPPPPHFL